MIKRILDYGARPLSEFNKFESLDMLEALQNAARDQGDDRAGFFRLAYQSARSKLDLPVEHFRSLILRCVGDKDHSKIFDIVAKVDKVANSTAQGNEGQRPYMYSGRSPRNSYPLSRLPVRCYNCNQLGHRAARCFRRLKGDQSRNERENSKKYDRE